MNKRLIGVLAFAFLISAGASVVLYRLLSARISSSATGTGQPIVVAARNLEVGTLIREMDLRVMSWNGPPPAQAVASAELAVGRGVIAAIYDNEPVLENRLAPKGAGGGMAATIPIGMRAVAVRVDDVTGLAGFVTPGLRVDVLVLGTPPGVDSQHNGTMSRTLLQNMEVLSAGQQIQKDVEGKPIPVPVVNLLATPEQSEILSLANANARIQLILRNPMDKAETDTKGTVLARLFDGRSGPPKFAAPVFAGARSAPRVLAAAPVPAAKPVPPPTSLIVEVLHGTKRMDSKFAEPEREKDKTQD